MRKTLSLVFALTLVAQPVWAEAVDRIASAGGDITEILFALGAGDKVVAVDTTSIFPERVNDLPKVGYVRELSAEGVLATGADLLVGSADMGPPAVMDNLEAAGMRVAYVPEGTGADRYPEKVTYIAEALGLEARGADLIASYEADLAKIEERKKAMSTSPRVLLLLSVRDGAPIAAGRNTSGHDIIELSGGANVADSFEGWKPMNSEAIIAAAPDVIVLSTLHLRRLGGADVIMDRPDIRATPAGANQAYVALNPQMMLQFGPRAPMAMNDLMTAFESLPSN